jgi:hypothetical protein
MAWSEAIHAATSISWRRGPEGLSQTRVIEMPPGPAQLLSARPSQGQCSISSIATCDLGSLAPGSQAFVIVTIRPAGKHDLVSTAIASAKSSDGSSREMSAQTTTKAVRYEPALALRRPLGDTTFWINRNNTIQWSLRGVTGGVSIDLSRDDGATWTRVSEEADNVGFYDWTGTGGLTARARVRVTSLTRPELTQTSPAFTIATR